MLKALPLYRIQNKLLNPIPYIEETLLYGGVFSFWMKTDFSEKLLFVYVLFHTYVIQFIYNFFEKTEEEYEIRGFV